VPQSAVILSESFLASCLFQHGVLHQCGNFEIGSVERLACLEKMYLGLRRFLPSDEPPLAASSSAAAPKDSCPAEDPRVWLEFLQNGPKQTEPTWHDIEELQPTQCPSPSNSDTMSSLETPAGSPTNHDRAFLKKA
jgi:hypothetical protein